MSKTKLVVFITLLVILATVNWSIWNKVAHRDLGANLYLQLQPVDPRSIMQGDYMALRFALSRALADAIQPVSPRSATRDLAAPLAAQDGLVMLTLDSQGVGHFARLAKAQETALSAGPREMAVRYRIRGGKVKFVTNAFFFEEGQAKNFSRAEYGHFKVDAAGELLLIAMLDSKFKKIEIVD